MTAEAEVEALLDRLVDAWNRRDAASFAALFTPEADYVTGDGEWLHGREAIEGLVRAGSSEARAAIQAGASIRVAGGVASAVFRWAASPGDAVASRGVTTCVLARSGVDWLVERLQNTDEK